MPGVTGRPFPRGGRTQTRRVNLPVEDKRPKVPDGGGSGVSAQRDRVPHDKRGKGGRSSGVHQHCQRPGSTRRAFGNRAAACSSSGVRDGMPHVTRHARREWRIASTDRRRPPRRASRRLPDELTACSTAPGCGRGSAPSPSGWQAVHHPQPLVGVGAHRQRAATDAEQPQAERRRVPGPAVPHHARRRRQAVDRPVPGRQRHGQRGTSRVQPTSGR